MKGIGETGNNLSERLWVFANQVFWTLKSELQAAHTTQQELNIYSKTSNFQNTQRHKSPNNSFYNIEINNEKWNLYCQAGSLAHVKTLICIIQLSNSGLLEIGSVLLFLCKSYTQWSMNNEERAEILVPSLIPKRISAIIRNSGFKSSFWLTKRSLLFSNSFTSPQNRGKAANALSKLLYNSSNSSSSYPATASYL